MKLYRIETLEDHYPPMYFLAFAENEKNALYDFASKINRTIASINQITEPFVSDYTLSYEIK